MTEAEIEANESKSTIKKMGKSEIQIINWRPKFVINCRMQLKIIHIKLSKFKEVFVIKQYQIKYFRISYNIITFVAINYI